MDKEERMITREGAIKALYRVINCGIISGELEAKLQDIAKCISDEEQLRIHAWGMPDDDYITLHTAMRADSPDYKDFCKKQMEIFDKFAY
jgi:hypothetical protein